MLEQLLFACCLENARYEAAEQVFAAVSTAFFDWNEVRVSTVKELAEGMRGLPDPTAAATGLKQIVAERVRGDVLLRSRGHEETKPRPGRAAAEKFNGTSSFTVGHVTQAALGGHAIPLDRGALDVLYIVGAATEAEVKSAEVSGLERAIPKNKGAEFASLLHQLGAELVASPFRRTCIRFCWKSRPTRKIACRSAIRRSRAGARHRRSPPRPHRHAPASKPPVADKKKEEVKKKPVPRPGRF